MKLGEQLQRDEIVDKARYKTKQKHNTRRAVQSDCHID